MEEFLTSPGKMRAWKNGDTDRFTYRIQVFRVSTAKRKLLIGISGFHASRPNSKGTKKMAQSLQIVSSEKSRPTAKRRGIKAFSVTSLCGHTMYPPPVACAEFAGGEKIRMSFCQMAGKPWDFTRARRLLAQTIGNERGRSTPVHHKDLENLRRKVEAARTLAARPGSAGEGDAAKRALARLSKSEKLLAEKQAMAAAFDALNVYTRVYAPATDFVLFWVEHDGKRIDPAKIEAPARKALGSPRKRGSSPVAIPTPEPAKRPRNHGKRRHKDGHEHNNRSRLHRAALLALRPDHAAMAA
jgi:hypothetical protein